MPPVPTIKTKDFVKILEKIGFVLIRSKGSHHRFAHIDGRKTTVPIHGNKDLPKGLIRKIIKDDLEMEIEDFLKLK